MFERRLRMFLVIVFLGALLLIARAAKVQVVDGAEWLAEANASAERITYLDAPRGDLLDVTGKVIARDVPTFEACVNYRALAPTPNAKWLRQEAIRRGRKLSEWKNADVEARDLLIARETQGVINDLDTLWNLLADLSGQTRVQLDARREEISAAVEDKQRLYVQREFKKALEEYKNTPPAPWYERWISGDRVEPVIEDYEKKEIFDQFAFHPLLPDIRQDVYNRLKLAQDRFPQYNTGTSQQSVLDLRPAVRRDYAYADIAAQTIGRVRAVSKEDRTADPNAGDESRRYGLVDRIGGEGIEALLEQQLRGTRGERRTNRRGESVSVREPVKGNDVRTSLDLELCKAIQEAFQQVEFHGPKINGVEPPAEFLPMNGAAVVIDVKTGQVRALVSVPSFDLNQFDALYRMLAQDELNRPMVNRALMDAMEPGSTVKPIVGLAAVTQKLLKASDTVECDGYAHINGKRVERPRCWTMSMFGISHHLTNNNPHATGHLNLADAIERSCNVYFVTEGAKLGLDGLRYWMRQFGYGQPTRIGLPEKSGIVPNYSLIDAGERASAAWYASIGQGPVLATPIQIANEMATIARDGVWVRPTLLLEQLPPTTQPDGTTLPNRVDLNLDPDAVRAVKKGMSNVVDALAGTGRRVNHDLNGKEVFNLKIAAKTGTATAAQLTRVIRDDQGRAVLDENKVPLYEPVQYGTREAPNRAYPWYRLTGYEENGRPKGAHSWVGGFVPADEPKLAFAVYVEYGGSGGIGAASVVRAAIAKAIELNYLKEAAPKEPRDAPGNGAELLRVDPKTEE